MIAFDPVTNFLRSRGWAEETAQAGLEGLVATWDTAADFVGRGVYTLTLDDYLNDLDVRDALAGALAVATEAQRSAVSERLQAADVKFLVATHAVPACLWGADVAAEGGWDAESHWWYYRAPRKVGTDMAHDLALAGISAAGSADDRDSE